MRNLSRWIGVGVLIVMLFAVALGGCGPEQRGYRAVCRETGGAADVLDAG